MKVFLTGGTGFIGSNVLQLLLNRNIEVTAHRRNPNSLPKLKIDFPIKWLTKPVKEITPDDFKGIDILLHLASHSVQYPFDSLHNNIHFNVIEPIDLIHKFAESGGKNIIITGSCSEYGNSCNHYKFIPVNAPLLPVDSYGASKAMFYLAIRELVPSLNLRIKYLRLFHIYGPGENPKRLYPSLKYHSQNNLDFKLTLGEQIRDFVHVEDLSKTLLTELETMIGSNQTFLVTKNIGSGTPISLKEFVEKYWANNKTEGKLKFGALPYRKNEIMRYVPDINLVLKEQFN